MINTTGTIIGGAILGVSFIFSAYMFNFFIFLWGMYCLLIPFDIYTRVRIERKKPLEDGIRTQTRSKKAREGLTEKFILAVFMLIMAAIVYFINGSLPNSGDLCSYICICLSSILNLFIGLFMVIELSSIIENLIEYNNEYGRKNNPVMLLLGKTLGVVYSKLSDKLESKVDDLINKD